MFHVDAEVLGYSDAVETIIYDDLERQRLKRQ